MIRWLINFILSWFTESVKDEMRGPEKKVPVSATQYSGECVNLVKHFEGLYLEAYLCPAKIWTIGYGHTADIEEGMEISERDAIRWLQDDLDEAQGYVLSSVKVPLTQGQLDALVSFTFNLGVGNLRKSTLLRRLNKKRYEAAAVEFPRWIYAGGVQLNGLIRRRRAEKKLFEGRQTIST